MPVLSDRRAPELLLISRGTGLAGKAPPPAMASLRRTAGRTARTAASCAGRSSAEVAGYYGTALPPDQVLVVRSFEIWAHHEDVRRATGRPPPGPR